MQFEEIRERLEAFWNGKLKMLYVAPERFRPDFMNELKGKSIELFAIDEAHCISEWGHEFRRAYVKLGDVIRELNPRSVTAVTATATPKVRDDIVRLLGRPNMIRYIEKLDRPELKFSVIPAGGERNDHSRKERVRGIISKRPGTSIVYVRRQEDADQLSLYLNRSEIAATSYHAGLEIDQRQKSQEEWQNGEVDVAVATIAFGMGIDKKDVHTIISFIMADSLERFYQEVGRAGRDGEKSECILLHHCTDKEFQEWILGVKNPKKNEINMVLRRLRRHRVIEETQFGRYFPLLRILDLLIEQGYLEEDPNAYGSYLPCGEIPDIGMLNLSRLDELKEYDKEKLDAMRSFIKTKKCRTAVILNYFGEKTPSNYKCGHCDNCLK